MKSLRQVWPSCKMALYLTRRIKTSIDATSSCSLHVCTSLIKTLKLFWNWNTLRLWQKEGQNHPIMLSLYARCAKRHKNLLTRVSATNNRNQPLPINLNLRKRDEIIMDENLPFVSQVKTHRSTSLNSRLYLPVKVIHENLTSFSDHRFQLWMKTRLISRMMLIQKITEDNASHSVSQLYRGNNKK